MSLIQVVLLGNVRNMGAIGDLVKVRRGYAKNYLLPNGIAALASDHDIMSKISKLKEEAKIADEAKLKSSQEIMEKLENSTIKILELGSEDGKLFGSINQKTISEKIFSIHNIEVKPGDILLRSPIKNTGVHSVSINLHPQVTFNINVEAQIPEKRD